jgi:hypothetical protein
MRIIIKGTDKNFHILRSKVLGKSRVIKEISSKNCLIVKISNADSDFLFEILSLGGNIERDIQNDLD